MCKWGDLDVPQWVLSLPSPEQRGVDRVYVLFLGSLEMAGICLITDLCPSPLLLVVSVLGTGYQFSSIQSLSCV